MDFHNKEILKRYARMAMGRPFAPILLNVLITSVCDMRCVHCFFTEELDDKARKKLQMTTQNVERISETRGQSRRPDHCGRRTVYGRTFRNRESFLYEQQARCHRPDVEWTDQQRILPDVARILEECRIQRHRGAGNRRIEG